MIAKYAYLTTPAPGIFVLNIQVEDEAEISRFEISQAHLANILIDGTALALRSHGQVRSDRLNEAVGTLKTEEKV